MTRPPRRRPSCRPPAGGSSPPTRPPRSSSPGRACPGVAAPPCAPARAARWWPGEPQDDRRRGGRGHPRLVLRVLAGPGSGLVRRRRRRGDRGGPGGHADPAAAPPGRNGRHPARPRRAAPPGAARPVAGKMGGVPLLACCAASIRWPRHFRVVADLATYLSALLIYLTVVFARAQAFALFVPT